VNVNVKRNSSGRAVSIDLTEVPPRPRPAEADEAIAVIGDALGLSALAVVKVSGYWLLGTLNETPGAGWRPTYGHRPGEQTRSFDKLIREGLQVTVCRLVSTR
jgi:hypothetical protein